MNDETWTDRLLARLVDLVKEDRELHDAVVEAVQAHAHYSVAAAADHEHALAERARASSLDHSASAKRGKTEKVIASPN